LRGFVLNTHGGYNISAPTSIYRYVMIWPNRNGLRTLATLEFGLKINKKECDMIEVRENAHMDVFSHFPFRIPSRKSADSVEEKRPPQQHASCTCTDIFHSEESDSDDENSVSVAERPSSEVVEKPVGDAVASIQAEISELDTVGFDESLLLDESVDT
jgi:hypothetical protein